MNIKYTNLGEFEEDATNLGEFVEVDDLIGSTIHLFTLHMRCGEIKKAEGLIKMVEKDLLKIALERRLGEVELLIDNCHSASTQQKWDLVLSETEKALENSDLNAQLYLYRADAHLHRDDVKEALPVEDARVGS